MLERLKRDFIQLFGVKKRAFTLAEVLITLGIIGVVSAMTIPNLITNYQTEALERKKELFIGRFEEAMNQMRFHERLTGYSDVEDFLEELDKFYKISFKCENSELTECFADTVKTSRDDKDTMTDMLTGYDIGSSDIKATLFTDNLGVMFADGVSAIINYKSDCEWLEPFESGGTDRSAAGDCVSMVYDLNGRGGRNTAGVDIYSYNSTIDCLVLLDSGTCMNQTAFKPTPMTYAECDAQKSSLGISQCCSVADCANKDYWAGGVAQCGGVSKAASLQDLADLASIVYDTSIGANENKTVNVVYEEYMSYIGLSIPSDGDVGIWSGEETSATQAYIRAYRQTYTDTYADYGKNATWRYTLCVE
ncbi:MAG: type II secretion system protein [Candidatus Gastranaerophilales bacterium]